MIATEILYSNITFYDNEPPRDEPGSCSWDPLRGKSRLLYECVWIVSKNQSSAHPAPTLDVRLRGSKCATREVASKLHLGRPICALRDISQLIASHESTRPWGRHWCFAIGCCLEDHTILCKPNYLAELLSRQSFRGRCWGVLLEDSNLVDPASSHTLVSKIKPCMSKYKYYTAKLRMAH